VSTCTEPKVIDPPTTEDELAHTVCECNLNVALCGADVSEAHRCPMDLSCGCSLCIVCEDLLPRPCQRCGT
jgi:hypothetical protein